MFIEITGVVTVIISAMLISAGLIREHRIKLRELESLYDMIAYIRDNIEYLMKPLPDIFDTYSNDFLEACGFLRSVRETNLSQAWNEQMFSISGEEYKLVDEFVNSIGSGYRTEELRLCEYTLDRFEGIIEKVRSESKNKIKLYKTVPMMLALSVILILI